MCTYPVSCICVLFNKPVLYKSQQPYVTYSLHNTKIAYICNLLAKVINITMIYILLFCCPIKSIKFIDNYVLIMSLPTSRQYITKKTSINLFSAWI